MRFMLDLETIGDLASNPEYKSIEDFVSFCMDDDRETFNHIELRALALNTRTSGNKVRMALEGYGLTLAHRDVDRKVRGFTANPHDRWIASGNCGGSGAEQIQGFAGRIG